MRKKIKILGPAPSKKTLKQLINVQKNLGKIMSDKKRIKPKKPVTNRQISPEREAEELRSGIEKIIEEKGELVRNMVAFDADELVVLVGDLRSLLDSVDARDSLAFLEKKQQRSKKKKI
jgi:hypothetical protein